MPPIIRQIHEDFLKFVSSIAMQFGAYLRPFGTQISEILAVVLRIYGNRSTSSSLLDFCNAVVCLNVESVPRLCGQTLLGLLYSLFTVE